jgi:processive 1,2-diacylglycerol beta-glucosyltransferase
MRARGLPPDRIHVSGIPIMPAFAQVPDRQACAATAGLDASRPVVLLMGGGAGVGALDEAAEGLLRLDLDFQLVALAGRNEAMLARLQRIAAQHPRRLFPQGFTRTIERLMGCADLAIGKPGGLTTSECLALGLPLIVFAPIPGQEERNCDYLLEQGAGLKAVDAVALEYRVRALLADPQRLAHMRGNALRLGRPQAAHEVLREVFATA